MCAGLAKYGKGQATDDLAEAVDMLFERCLLPKLPPPALQVSNDFRTERLYNEEVDVLFKKHQVRQPWHMKVCTCDSALLCRHMHVLVAA